MSFRSGTGWFLRAHRVKNSRAGSNRLTTKNRNFHIRFLKVQGTDPWINKVFEFIVSSFTEDNPLSWTAVVFRKSEEREIWSIMSAISADSHGTKLYHGNRLSKSTEDKKSLTEIFLDWQSTWLESIFALFVFCVLFPRTALWWIKFGTSLSRRNISKLGYF